MNKDPIESKSNEELLQSTLAEVAKASNELRCVENDVKKASNRLKFLIVLVNHLKQRLGEQK